VNDLDRCHTAALRILSYRFNSEAELRRKLSRKDFERGTVDAAIERLRAEGWIDDGRFAGAFVRTRAAKSIGRKRIARELQAAGVDDDTASRALRENVDEEGESESLRALAQKRARLLLRRNGPEWLASAEGRNKLTAWLLKQGYDAGLVVEAVRRVAREINEGDAMNAERRSED
jgi:regulatory protein